ncbi:MAG: hypothetical protein LBR53_05080 [Deltaproteobacteria bacterium]|jgi:hypothetical protein|nr:hypothetical protein [Deltaproteobacteria bacterium]
MADWKNPRFDRLWRLLALFALCGMVYYFSFDNGRRAAKTRIARYENEMARMEAEISSLRTRLELQSAEINRLKGEGPAAAPAAAPRETPSAPAAPAIPNAPPEAALPGEPPPERPADLHIPEGAPKGSLKEENDPREISRFSLRTGESKLILNDQARLSVPEIDSLDKVAQVRIQHLDTDNRHTRTMEAGDSFIITRGDERYILLLDQLKGSLALFILIGS